MHAQTSAAFFVHRENFLKISVTAAEIFSLLLAFQGHNAIISAMFSTRYRRVLALQQFEWLNSAMPQSGANSVYISHPVAAQKHEVHVHRS